MTKCWIPKSFLNQQISIRYYLEATRGASRGTVKAIKMPGAALSDSKLVLKVEGEEILISAIGGLEGFYESFFLGDLGGVILTEQDMKEHHVSGEINGCVARIVKVEEGIITYVTPMKVCRMRCAHLRESMTPWNCRQNLAFGWP